MRRIAHYYCLLGLVTRGYAKTLTRSKNLKDLFVGYSSFAELKF